MAGLFVQNRVASVKSRAFEKERNFLTPETAHTQEWLRYLPKQQMPQHINAPMHDGPRQ
jgi:hypothetical protein